uniref:Uncharacterized protein n=1 Tax=Romanomermis culicivorax TaxID=13658 RepID=A0A915ITU3_ROMCU
MEGVVSCMIFLGKSVKPLNHYVLPMEKLGALRFYIVQFLMGKTIKPLDFIQNLNDTLGTIRPVIHDWFCSKTKIRTATPNSELQSPIVDD